MTDNQIELKDFTPDDFQCLYGWQTTPGIRKFFRNPEPPTWEDHVKWCKGLLENTTEYPYIINYEEQAAGFIRITRLDTADDNEEYEISILLDPEHRGQSIAQQALTITKKRFGNSVLKAYIYPENASSIKLFEKAGFNRQDNQENWYKWECKK